MYKFLSQQVIKIFADLFKIDCNCKILCFRSRNGDAVLIPGPKLSRKLSEFVCLPHIVQVCLTHDPGLLERVASLLCQIMEVCQQLIDFIKNI